MVRAKTLLILELIPQQQLSFPTWVCSSTLVLKYHHSILTFLLYWFPPFSCFFHEIFILSTQKKKEKKTNKNKNKKQKRKKNKIKMKKKTLMVLCHHLNSESNRRTCFFAYTCLLIVNPNFTWNITIVLMGIHFKKFLYHFSKISPSPYAWKNCLYWALIWLSLCRFVLIKCLSCLLNYTY